MVKGNWSEDIGLISAYDLITVLAFKSLYTLLAAMQNS